VTSYDARKDPPRRPDPHSLSGLAEVAAERLDEALAARRHRMAEQGNWVQVAQLDCLLAIASTLTRMSAPAATSRAATSRTTLGDLEDRLATIERTLVALTNSAREAFARIDTLDERMGD
jgi:hypothetical protein